MIIEKEQKECIADNQSRSLSNDMKRLADNRHNPIFKDGKVDIDNYIRFLNVFNEFVNHSHKPFNQLQDRIMKI